MSLLTPAVTHGCRPSAWKLSVTRTCAAESCAETSIAFTLNVPSRICLIAGYHFSSSLRIALVSASTGPSPSAREVRRFVSFTVSVINACTNRPPASSDSSNTRHPRTANRFGSVPITRMQASRKLTSLTVNPPPSTIALLSSISRCACSDVKGTPSDSDSSITFARPLKLFTPIVGVAPTFAGSHHRYAPGFLRSLLPCIPAHVPNAPPPTIGEPCGVSRLKAEYARFDKLVSPVNCSAVTNSASPRNCIPPTRVVKFTFPQRSPVPSRVP